MLRFDRRDHRRPRYYLSRREQWRLLLLIVPLGLVLILIGRLRDPATADRMNQLFAPVGAEAQGIEPAGQPSPPTTSPAAAPSPPPDAVRSETSNEPSKSASRAGLYPKISPDRLSSIQDNTYFRNSEKGAWFHFLEIMHRTPAEEIAAAHGLEANYVQLVDQSDFYRGKLVTVYGYVRQVTEQTPAKNDLGLERYFRIVMQPADGNYWPVFVYSLELPPDLRLGENSAGGNAKVTGLFFKKLSYRWRDGLGTAPVIVAKSITYHGVAPGGPGMTDIHPPIEEAATPTETNADIDAKQNHGEEPPTLPTSSFRDILELAGWSVDRLATFDDGGPLTDEQRTSALELLRRLRSFSTSDLAAWVHDDLTPRDVLQRPADYRGQLVRLTGRVTKVAPHSPPAVDAQRLEMPQYFECDLTLDHNAGTATILATRVPKAWLGAENLDEPMSANALFLKKVGAGDAPPSIWLAAEIAWHPGQASGRDAETFGPDVSELFGDTPDRLLGKSILGHLGMDVGQLDLVDPRGRIRPEEREAFYQMLAAVGKIDPHILAQLAKTNLSGARDYWKRRLENETDPSRRALAQEALHRAKNGRYSTAALFNDPQSQMGQLVVVDGAARRVVRVEVGAGSADDAGQDIVGRFGFDHYYEMEVFTDDSQNYPLVFVVHELPDGFPTGESIHVPVRVAGFFFKDWLYHTRGGAGDETTAVSDPAQYAPLLLGSAPLIIKETAPSNLGRWIGGGLFLLALGAICVTAAWLARGDRAFRERTRAANYSLPPGTSLDDLNLATADSPGDFSPSSASSRDNPS
jgi:hypothetical protein